MLYKQVKFHHNESKLLNATRHISLIQAVFRQHRFQCILRTINPKISALKKPILLAFMLFSTQISKR